HVLRRQQPHLMAERLELTAPGLRGAAGFHHKQALGMRGCKGLEAPAGEREAALHSKVLVGDSELESVLCQVDANGRRMHVGLLLFGQLLSSYQLGTTMPIHRQEESISSSLGARSRASLRASVPESVVPPHAPDAFV